MFRFIPIVIALVAIVSAAGCHDHLQGRKAIGGAVTLKGEPLKDGSLSFDPIGAQEIRTATGAMIVNGKYHIAAAHGLVPGEYLARIMAVEILPLPPHSRPDDEPPIRNLVPPDFGAQSTQKIIVTESGKQVFDFNM